MDFLTEHKRTWAEIDLCAAEKNFNIIKNVVAPETKVCCTVKANAYGHSAEILVPFYASLGADWFAVSNIEEALQIRSFGVKEPIIILGFTPPKCACLLAANNISQTLYSSDYANALAAEAEKAGVKIKVHIKIDSGMGRIGFKCRGVNDEAELEAAYKACSKAAFEREGIFTHFAVADGGENGRSYTQRQCVNFIEAVDYLKSQNMEFSLVHCSNSAAISDYKRLNIDMVRAGIILYGAKPSNNLLNPLPVTPVMTLKSVVSHVKTIKRGDSVSYGCTFTASKEMRVATIAAGYADGIMRCGSNGVLKVLVREKLCPVIGRICMDQMMIDVTDVPDVKIFDEAVIFGQSPALTVDDIAEKEGTIGYELLCAVSARVPRIAMG